VDADAVATRPLTPLLTRPMPPSVCIAAADNIRYGAHALSSDEINSGVMLVRPNATVFSQLEVRLSRYRTRSRGGQHFLSHTFLDVSHAPCQREKLGVDEHGNLAVFSWLPHLWPSRTPTIVHYTIYKPSRSDACTNRKYERWCKLWANYSRMSRSPPRRLTASASPNCC
jgi:hypothetical protein